MPKRAVPSQGYLGCCAVTEGNVFGVFKNDPSGSDWGNFADCNSHQKTRSLLDACFPHGEVILNHLGVFKRQRCWDIF